MTEGSVIGQVMTIVLNMLTVVDWRKRYCGYAARGDQGFGYGVGIRPALPAN